jgi:hypothetical protein
MFERFTKEARRVVLASVGEAADAGTDVTPVHLLLALVAGPGAGSGEWVGARVLAGFGVTEERLRAALRGADQRAGLSEEEIAALRALGIDAEEVFRRLSEAFGPDALAEPAPPARRRRLGRLGTPFVAEAKKALELSLREAIALRHRQIGSEHLLLALLRTGVPGPAGAVLADQGVTYDEAKRRVLDELSRAA